MCFVYVYLNRVKMPFAILGYYHDVPANQFSISTVPTLESMYF